MTRVSSKRPLNRRVLAAVVVAVISTQALLSWPAFAQDDNGHILISDQFNNRVVEVDPSTHKVVWHFGNGSDLPGPHSVVGVNDAERIGPFTLISGTGTPPGLPGCSDTVNGCPDNRVFFVDPQGDILWQYGQAGVTGSGPDQLNTPVHSLYLNSFPQHFGPHVLITDQGNQRVILVDLGHHIEWQYGTTGVSGNGSNQLNNPNSAEVLENGHVLIADENNNRVIEIKPNLQIVKQFTAQGTISGAAFASRLANGDTLISDSNNNRIVEVNGNDQVVWEYFTNTQSGSNPAPLPTRAVRLRNGNTLISDQFNNRVIEVNMAKHIVFQQGALNAPGNGFNELNGPYDAKVIGDFTGLTPPFDL
ncbi:hypothetical protein [Dyella sp. 20L07]|uniref:hypothetical protein n=1 Tax=Dyella sp. 20L07 TaxID=3384240 RepID=UPI003D265D08